MSPWDLDRSENPVIALWPRTRALRVTNRLAVSGADYGNPSAKTQTDCIAGDPHSIKLLTWENHDKSVSQTTIRTETHRLPDFKLQLFLRRMRTSYLVLRGVWAKMFIPLGSPLSLKSLAVKDRSNVSLRPLLSLAVIDDQPFDYAQRLRAHGFNIAEVGDISDIRAVADYSIVICDIKGVGKVFKSNFEGGHVISEIRNRYPDKYIIAYSGSAFNPTFKRFLDKCDQTMSKDADIEDWISALDVAVEELGDPVKRWLRFRAALLNRGMELYDVLKLEHAYIRAVSKKRPNLISDAASKISFFEREELLRHGVSALTAFVTDLVVGSVANQLVGPR